MTTRKEMTQEICGFRFYCKYCDDEDCNLFNYESCKHIEEIRKERGDKLK